MKIHLLIPMSVLSAFILSACAQKNTEPFAYDAVDYDQAFLTTEEQAPVTIIEVTKPLPLPGQLKPLPEGYDNPSSPKQVIEKAQTASVREPKGQQYLNAVQVYPYSRGALYKLYAAPEQVTDVTLAPGEKLISVSAGDTLRWIIGDTSSGAGENMEVHILVKPQEAGLKTNMVIMTDRRSYHLELESLPETYMASLSWHYPHSELIALKKRNAGAFLRENHKVAIGVDPANLQFRYEIEGDQVPWKPLRAFDDGRKVYIQFPSGIGQGEVPPLFVVGMDGETELVNYRMRAGYFIVDRLFAAAELRAGTRPQQVVRIKRLGGGARIGKKR